ncbi:MULTISPECIES: DUF4944 domain-containing protein [Bacillus]|uniref:DUF4944 domain-containing protein n=1 Tax=Bacillus glycinifermentans TaxID=1664069 RepID=A0AAJ4D244_9BACI|nr:MULTISPECIES: DUF4944 domain-containing protein [Bacillus]KKB74862.1 hypothetical protein TH62_05000 [Bacillus sp. TH008]MDU0071538.1 DUF4944 domain-containing protein [Bacillus sp. IG6]MED8019369.1 DUF4944 domain-containing protein [Bacillus glycinifermentans]QAT64452.1 DUF4944 domain-containing protein [Bacillus glycinifermentans]WKB78389.1 DUF4944 domain-containing protein [Bacillus glycinifermentans]
MKQEYKRPVMFAAAVFFVFCCVYSGAKLIAFYSAEYPKWIGNSRDGNWQAVIKKSGDAPGFSGNLYWTGSRTSLRETYLERLVVTFDDEVFLCSDIETPMVDYSGGTFPDGGSKEESVSFLERIQDAELKGRDITVQLTWRQGTHAAHAEFALDRRTLFH